MCCSGHFQFVIFVSFHHGDVSMHASPLLMCWKRVFKKNKQSSPKRIFVFFCTFGPGTLCSEFIQQAKMLPSFVVHRIPAGHGQQQKRQHLQGLRFCKENVPQCSTHVQCNHLFDNSHKGFPLLKLCGKTVNIYIYICKENQTIMMNGIPCFQMQTYCSSMIFYLIEANFAHDCAKSP